MEGAKRRKLNECQANKNSSGTLVKSGVDIVEDESVQTNAENDNHLIDSMTDSEKYGFYKRLCKAHGFKPPIRCDKFKIMGFPYVSTFDSNHLQHGSRFLTKEELSSIPRKIDKPFCHPGPELKCSLYHWYLADSIIQEVHLKYDTLPNFVVRWVGYEDDYNTVEPLAFVKHTAIYNLFKNQDIYTACRSNNGCLRRRTTARGTESLSCKSFLEIAPTKSEHVVNNLISKLQIEERAGRYNPEIGFFSYKSSADALKAQRKFIVEKYVPLIKELNAPLFVDDHYIGTTCGNLQAAAQFKGVPKCQSKASVKSYIYHGIREASKTKSGGPHYVCFFVPMKHGRAEKSRKKQLNFHMCVYAIRTKDRLKDAIYYNPSPPCYQCDLPEVLDELTDPVMQSVTNKFGVASDKDDCLFKCLSYIIGLATGDIKFEPDHSQPSRKYDRFIVKKNL